MRNARYKLTPHMETYVRIGQVWLPYLMYFHTPNFCSDVVNTDSHGFRVSYKKSTRLADFKDISGEPKCLLVGGSTAFGLGATHDKYTIPSILNQITDYLWLNFGGSGFSSTQELLLFLFNYQHLDNIKKIVLFSGINNLALYYLSWEYSQEYGSFFYCNKYRKAMQQVTLSAKRKILKLILYPFLRNRINYATVLPHTLWQQLCQTTTGPGYPCAYTKIMDYEKEKENLLYTLQRDIKNWKLLTDNLGIKFYYVLQPLANWIIKGLSREEEILFRELDSYTANNWRVLRENMGPNQYLWFKRNLQEICSKNGISFFDMNEAISGMRLDGKWLYVDRAHFTDEGSTVIANIIKNEVICK